MVVRRVAWRSPWLDMSTLALITIVLVKCLDRRWDEPPMLAPLLAVPPALAGIGAASVRRPLAYGGVSMLAALFVWLKPTEFAGSLPGATMFTIVVITAVATLGTAVNVRQERRIATVRSVAEAAQHALLRPPPQRLGGLGFDVVYVAAAAEAMVGGDLYEVTRTAEHGIRVIMGDVRGKGLDAVELAADILGMFRELAHDAHTLGELAIRLDTGLGRSLGRYEEFVTALLVEIDQESGRASIFNCGHPPPVLISAAAGDAEPGDPGNRSVALMEVPAPAPPLGLLALGDCSGGQLSLHLQPNDQLLLYTDGVTEARDARRRFYPLPERITALARAAVRTPASNGSARHGLLDLLRADLLKHVGAPLEDDAALLLIQAPATWSPSLATVTSHAEPIVS
ncbi:PP2C family protein-serine/threonine phosphatase [Trebonia kvetii]|uniref:PP2C family protein-serine/threonine phosphatase n=1 Tax=Trebonia kvetii TaxID=2480626 RepID=UPI00165224DE|nr:PP2C family protein-serine/threonine phosphatase [Trebonia kvetii]